MTGPGEQLSTSRTLAEIEFVGRVLRQQAVRLVDALTEAEAQRNAADKAIQQATWEASQREEAEQRVRALQHAAEELEALRNSRLYRWSALPRRAYHRFVVTRRRRP